MPARSERLTQALPGKRIAVLGVAGSGKTTVARQLAQILGRPHIELDSIHWGPNWAKPTPEDFRARVAVALIGLEWVTDGNYREARPVIWTRATTLVWLDYPLRVSLCQLIWRTFRRVITREKLWNGNRETLRGVFFSRDALFFYAFSSHRRQRINFPKAFREPQHAHLQIIHLRSRAETRRWLEEIRRAVNPPRAEEGQPEGPSSPAA